MTKEQEENALSMFCDWIAHPNELGKEPAEMEIFNWFDYGGYQYAIIKFKAEKGEPWKFGVGGGFKDDGSSNIINWSEFEPFEGDVKEECIGYLKRYEEGYQKFKEGIIYRLDQLINEKKWREVVDLVDKEIDSYRSPREEDGAKCYQFMSREDFFYYVCATGDENCVSVKSTELVMLRKQLYALIELNDDRAEEVAKQIEEISPNNFYVHSELFELAKRKNDNKRCWEESKLAYLRAWRAEDFARWLRGCAWLFSEAKEFDIAVYYLAWSLVFDNSDSSYEHVNGELDYICGMKGVENIERPTIRECNEFFIKNELPHEPPQEVLHAIMRLYDACLRNEEPKNSGLTNYVRQNLATMGGWEVECKLVETNVLTPNQLIVNFEYGFNLALPKDFQRENGQDNVIYKFKKDDKEYTLEYLCKLDSQDEYKKYCDYYAKICRGKDNFVSEGDIVCQSGKVFKRIITKDPDVKTSFIVPLGQTSVGQFYYNGEGDELAMQIIDSIEINR